MSMKLPKLLYTRPDHSFYPGVFPDPELVHCRIGGCPGYMNGLRVLFLSDVHLRRSVSDARLNALMARIATQKADLILLGGDYAEGSDQCLRFFRAFQGISAPLGCFAVPGNNDADSADKLEETMASAGVTLLRNTAHSISLAGGTLEVGGCDDHKYGNPYTRSLFGEESYRILLSHYPVLPDCQCELMLSGHTHAGQCNVLGITPYSIGFEHHFHLLGVRSMQQIGDIRLLIGNGIGVSRFPFRLNARPEIYLLEFTRQESF